MVTIVPEIIVVVEPLPAQNQDDTAAPDTVTSTGISSTLRGLFARRILVSSVLTGFFYNFHEPNWLENWRANFGYLLPVVVIETIWNLLLVAVSVVVMIWSAASNERNVLLLRVWISVYMFQCVLHVLLMWKEYFRKSNSTDAAVPTQISSNRRWDMSIAGIWYSWSLIAILWMIDNFHFKILLHDAPRLFWLTFGFLVSSELFLASLIVSFCSMVWLMFISFGKVQISSFEGASENYISALPNYIYQLPNCIFELSNSVERNDGKAGRMMPLETNNPDWSNEIPTDDVDCSICRDLYENGSELKLLPCKHNFHAACIRKWLRMKRICPICKQELK